MTDQTKIPIQLISENAPGASGNRGVLQDGAAMSAGPDARPVKELGADKVARNTARFDQAAPVLRKPPWIRVRLPAGNAVANLKTRLRDNRLVTVCALR